jgi:hypothetical protein
MAQAQVQDQTREAVTPALAQELAMRLEDTEIAPEAALAQARGVA